MPRYVLLLHQSPDVFKGLGPEEIRAALRKYEEWREKLDAAGKLVGTQKLREEGRAIGA